MRVSTGLSAWEHVRTHPTRLPADTEPPKDLPQQEAGTPVRQQLSLHQVHSQCLEVRAILHFGFHDLGKRRLARLQTHGAAFLLDLMFRDPEAFLGEIDHLTALDDLGWLALQRSRTLLALLHVVENHFIDLLHGLQMMALVARLASRLFPA